MDYTILYFNKETGSIIVKYDENMSPLNIDIPLNEQGLFITGEELDKYIQGFIPVWHLERIAKLKNGIANAHEIEQLVVPVDEPVTPEQIDEQVTENIKMWADLEFEKQVARSLVKFGLLDYDPTATQAI